MEAEQVRWDSMPKITATKAVARSYSSSSSSSSSSSWSSIEWGPQQIEQYQQHQDYKYDKEMERRKQLASGGNSEEAKRSASPTPAAALGTIERPNTAPNAITPQQISHRNPNRRARRKAPPNMVVDLSSGDSNSDPVDLTGYPSNP